MYVVFPNLVGEIARRGVKKSVMAARLGISPRALHSKISGETSFTWEEACKIGECFFPDMDKDTLFSRDAPTRT